MVLSKICRTKPTLFTIRQFSRLNFIDTFRIFFHLMKNAKA